LEAKFEQDRLTKVASKTSTTCRTTDAELISWLQEQSRTEDDLDSNYILNEDFQQALKRVQPSTQREGFATVPDVTWDDIGALADIRKELHWSIIVSFILYVHDG
jgi:SpoVK/Ycf46/Vps4 family AAA+-type ATPase